MWSVFPDLHVSFTLPLWVVAAYFPCVLLHELGHAVVGRLAGFRIAAVGLGFGRPWLQLRHARDGELGTVLYLAGCLSGGLTIATDERLRPPPLRTAALLAGGVLGNVAGAAAGLALFHLGARVEAVAAFFYVSALLVLVAGLPIQFKAGGTAGKGGAMFASDGWLALRMLRGTLVQETEPGPTIGHLRYCRDFAHALDHPGAEAHFAAFLATWELGVGDVEGAAATLASPCFDDPRRGDHAHAIEAYARAGLARARGDADVDARVVHALWAAGDDPLVPPALALVAAVAALDRGAPPAEVETAVGDALELARAADAGAPDLETAALALVIEAAPDRPDPALPVGPQGVDEGGQRSGGPPSTTVNRDPLGAARALLGRGGAAGLPRLNRVRLLGATAHVLAARGRTAEARALCQETGAEVARLAAAIEPARTREAFVERACRPVRAALAALGDDVPPLLLPEPPPPAPEPRTSATRILKILLVGTLLGLVGVLCAIELGHQTCPAGRRPDAVVLPFDPVAATRWEAELFRRHAGALRLMHRRAEAARFELAAECIEDDTGGFEGH